MRSTSTFPSIHRRMSPLSSEQNSRSRLTLENIRSLQFYTEGHHHDPTLCNTDLTTLLSSPLNPPCERPVNPFFFLSFYLLCFSFLGNNYCPFDQVESFKPYRDSYPSLTNHPRTLICHFTATSLPHKNKVLFHFSISIYFFADQKFY